MEADFSARRRWRLPTAAPPREERSQSRSRSRRAGGGVSNRQLLKFLKRLKHFLEAGVRVPALQFEVSEAVVVVFFQS